MSTAAEQWDEVTREQLRSRSRSRRKRAVRPRTISILRTPLRELELGRQLYPETGYWRPQTRGDCGSVPRPCPYVGCRWHLYLDVNEDTGSLTLNFPDLEVCDMEESCALDVADDEGCTLERCGDLLNLTRERIRQLELRALDAVCADIGSRYLAQHAEARSTVRRTLRLVTTTTALDRDMQRVSDPWPERDAASDGSHSARRREILLRLIELNPWCTLAELRSAVGSAIEPWLMTSLYRKGMVCRVGDPKGYRYHVAGGA